MLERVRATIVRQRMLEPGMRVGVAVSGGADSMCLLDVLLELAAEWRLLPIVLHLNHGLRGAESDGDEAFVRETAARLSLPGVFERAEIASGNLEQSAREARREFFHRQIRSGAVDRVATGHTLSDQAETVLFRLLRGAGGAGLSGIRPVTREGIVRPLLDVTRDEVRRRLEERGLPWREDSTNADLSFDRNRIRRDLLPVLERDWNPAIASTLAHTAEWALAEEEYWNQQIDRLAAGFQRTGNALLVGTGQLREAPVAVVRRLVRRAVAEVKGDLHGIGFEHVEAIRLLAESDEGHGRVQAPGIDVMRSFEWLRLAPPEGNRCEARDFSQPLAVPGAARLPDGSVISVEIVENSETMENKGYVYNDGMGCVDRDLVAGSLEVRNWRPGDQYQPAGSTSAKKIKTLFQEARIPLWERRHWPVIVGPRGILWSRRFGPAEEIAARRSTRVLLAIREAPYGSGIAAVEGSV